MSLQINLTQASTGTVVPRVRVASTTSEWPTIGTLQAFGQDNTNTPRAGRSGQAASVLSFTVTSPTPLSVTITGTPLSALAELTAAVARGPMGQAGGCTDPGQAVEVKQTSEGFNVRLTTGGLRLHTQDVAIPLSDLQNGHLTEAQRQALDAVHEQLQTPAWPAS